MKNINRFLSVLLVAVFAVAMSVSVFAVPGNDETENENQAQVLIADDKEADDDKKESADENDDKKSDKDSSKDSGKDSDKDDSTAEDKPLTKNQLMIKSFQIMGVGMAGIFIVIAAIALSVGLLTKFFPVKKQ